ncbi:hypothetical protein GCM10018954_062530 [Kutzneria kofuensis]
MTHALDTVSPGRVRCVRMTNDRRRELLKLLRMILTDWRATLRAAFLISITVASLAALLQTLPPDLAVALLGHSR